MNETKIISIDLGAQNTGIVFGDAEDSVGNLNNVGGVLLHLKKSEQQWSQETRRSARHIERGYQRRRLAKRMLWTIIRNTTAADIAPATTVFITGLLNRRGFTFISERLDKELFFESDGTILHELASDIFPSGKKLSDCLAKLSNSNEYVLKHPVFADDIFKKPAKEAANEAVELWNRVDIFLKECGNKQKQKNIRNKARDFLKESKNRDGGHFSREEYLQNIHADINARFAQDTNFVAFLKNVGWTEEEFFHIVGHVSNLPLRVLRKYFNDKTMKEKDFYNNERFCTFLINEVIAWYYDKQDEKKENRQNYLNALSPNWKQGDKKIGDVLTAWKKLSPQNTVPPFENQANRNPPKCMNLLINSSNKELDGDWADVIIDAFLANETWHGDDLDKEQKAYRSRVLQRILDTSQVHDKYDIRGLVFAKKRNERKINALNNMLLEKSLIYKTEYLETFLQFAKKYYEESAQGAQGAWSEGEDSILRRCELNPPHKKGIQDVLIARVLGCHKEAIGGLEKFLRENKSGNNNTGRKLFNICYDSSRLQKKHGNEMKFIYENALRLAQQHDNTIKFLVKNPPDNISEDELKQIGEVHGIYEDAKAAAGKIAWYLEHDEKQRKHYDNPFSLAQIYQHLNGVDGFSSTCRECSHDNAGRMRMCETDEGEWRAVAKALPSDSVRPFDGMLRRIMEAQAAKIAALQMQRLEDEEFDGVNKKLQMTICIEQNAFNFTKDLADIKKSLNKEVEKRAYLGQKRMEEEATNKSDRLRKIKINICPYTGKPITRLNIDHIISRATCRGSGGSAAFNSEVNLIACSDEGNIKKGDRNYFLEDLNKTYLHKVFGTDNLDKIKEHISDNVRPILHKKYTSFAELDKENPEAANCLRHALFVDRLRDEIINKILTTERMARVNGTQRFLAKKVWEELDKSFLRKGWQRPRRQLLRANAQEVHVMRELLLKDKAWQKTKQQGAMSHVADAMVSFVVASGGEKINENAMPKEVRIEHLEKRKPWHRKDANAGYKIFADGIYGERFLPLLVLANGECKIGFTPDNSISIKEDERQTWLTVLKPFWKHDYLGNDQDVLQRLTEKAKQCKDGFLCLTVNRQKAKEELLQHWQAIKSGDKTQNAAKYLEILRYVIRKQNLENEFFPLNQKQLRNRDEILKDNYFKISLTEKTLKGSVVLPIRETWEELLDMLEKENPENIKENMPNVLREFFGRNKPQRKHYRHRNVYSLARLEKTSGVWRIRRRTPNGGHVFQLMATEKYTYEGFAKNVDNTADFSHEVPLKELLKSRWLAPAEELQKPTAAVYFDESEEVTLHLPADKQSSARKIYVAPGSKTRSMLRFVLPATDFLELAKKANSAWDDWRKIPPVITTKDNQKSFCSAVAEVLNLEVTPRDKIVVLRMSETEAEFEFSASSQKKSIKELFNKARKKHGG